MIRYALICADDHTFDGWFRSSADFDGQLRRGDIACPVCGTASVGRALMTPQLRTRRQGDMPEPTASATDVAMVPPAAPPEMQAMMSLLREMKARIVAGTEDVGGRFAEEARRIHFGETHARGIRGQATPDEAQALHDEGIEILPMPILPDERN